MRKLVFLKYSDVLVQIKGDGKTLTFDKIRPDAGSRDCW